MKLRPMPLLIIAIWLVILYAAWTNPKETAHGSLGLGLGAGLWIAEAANSMRRRK